MDKFDLKTKIESREFYDLMQIYRHTPVQNIVEVSEAFEEVKKFLLQDAKSCAEDEK